jgi:hypothetical protein
MCDLCLGFHSSSGPSLSREECPATHCPDSNGSLLPFFVQSSDECNVRIAERAQRDLELSLSVSEPEALRALAVELGLDRYDYFGDQFMSQHMNECLPEEDVALLCKSSDSLAFAKESGPSSRPRPCPSSRRAIKRLASAPTVARVSLRVSAKQARSSIDALA